MTCRLLRLLLTHCALAVAMYAVPTRQALVIGNDTYPGHVLKNARSDAESVAAILGSMGYRTMLKLDADGKDIDAAVNMFSGGLEKGDIALLFYSGHGIQVDGENYLIPTDFEATSPGDVQLKGYSVSRILDAFIRHGASTQIVILDACRDNPFLATRSFQGGWAGRSVSAGAFLAYGTSPGSTASDNPSETHGLFTKALLKYLSAPQLNINDLFEKVREDVIAASHGLQVPWTSSSLVGSLHLNPSLDAEADPAIASFGLSEGSRPDLQSMRSTGQHSPERLPASVMSEAAVGQHPSSEEAVHILVHQGLLLARQEQYQEAIRSLSAALALDPKSSVALRILGLIFQRLGRSTDALAELNQALNRDPTDQLAYYYRCLAEVGSDPVSSVRDCNASLGLQPNLPQAHLGLANALLALGQLERAYSEVNIAIRGMPHSAVAYATRGKLAAILGKYVDAQRDYETAARLAQPH